MNQSIDGFAEAVMVELPSVVQIERRCHLAYVTRCTRAGAAPLGDIRPRAQGVQRPPADAPHERAIGVVGERPAD
jgi:hypothetical protein